MVQCNQQMKFARVKIDGIERQHRINNIQDQISDIDKWIGFKNKRVEAPMAAKSFKVRM